MGYRLGLALVLFAACGGNHDAQDSGADVIPAGCGDGVKGGTEECDGTDLGGATCATAAAPGWVGVASCTAACRINIAGCNPPTTTWQTMTSAANWTLFDVSTLFPGAKGFAGSVFDGKYLYFIPNNNGAADGIVARYDTTGGLGSSSSWQTFDLTTISAGAKGYSGGAFDGRYIYMVPYNDGTTYHGRVARYDTKAAGGFGAPEAWQVFDLATVDPNARGYIRATFDGRYIYLGPHYNGAYHGIAARFDTQNAAGFMDAGSWETFDVTTAIPNARGFLGVAFDGRYVYYAPYYNGTVQYGNVTRFDTQNANGFKNGASWSSFDVASLNGNEVGFYGINFDGRYLYLSQYYDAAAMNYGGYVARYDTQAAFNAGGSWTLFDVSTVNGAARGFIGTVFDGRYLYLVPHYNNSNPMVPAAGYHGTVARYDSQSAMGFNNAGSWSTFDVSTINANARGFDGAGFDGQYVYIVPLYNGTNYHGIISRFNAKSPSWMPRGWSNLFD